MFAFDLPYHKKTGLIQISCGNFQITFIFPERLSIKEINSMFGEIGFALLRVKFKRHI